MSLDSQLQLVVDRIADEFKAVRLEIAGVSGGGLPTTGGTMTGPLNIEPADNIPSLTSGDDGGLRIGTQAGPHLAFGLVAGNPAVQAKATGTTTGTLSLNPLGGGVGMPSLSVSQSAFIGGELELGATLLVNDAASFYADVVIQAMLDVESSVAPNLAGSQVAFKVGAYTTTHIAIGGNDIQAKSNGTTTDTLDLNPLGGEIALGGRTIVHGGSGVTMSLGAGRLIIGSSPTLGAFHMAIDGATIQTRASGGTTTSGMALNPYGGAVTVNQDKVAGVETGTYGPTLTSITIGTGGSNTAEYTYIGDPLVGGHGILMACGQITLGTSGFSVATATNHAISLPAGFEFEDVRSTDQLQVMIMYRGSSTKLGYGWTNATTTFRPLYENASDTVAGLSPTLPFTWAAGNTITWTLRARVIRV